MSSDSLHEVGLELAWRLWSELGVPGVTRWANPAVIDPEPLVLWSPSVVARDPRLRDLVLSWCRQHGSLLSTSRLKGLFRSASPYVAAQFGQLSSTLRDGTSLRWPGGEDGSLPWPMPGAKRPMQVPMNAPALLRLRARALAGVGARADVLTELLLDPLAWRTASELVDLGYSKRILSKTLGELKDGGLALSHRRRNSLHFRLAAPQVLGDLLGAPKGPSVPWSKVFALLDHLSALERGFGAAAPIVQRVEADNTSLLVGSLALDLGLPPPPATRGNPEAFAILITWGLGQARQLVEGRALRA